MAGRHDVSLKIRDAYDEIADDYAMRRESCSKK